MASSASHTSSLLLLLLHSSLLFSLSFATKKPFRPTALVLPVTKDAATLQYITRLSQQTPPVPTPLVVDLDGSYFWVDCDSGYTSTSYSAILCNSTKCAAANGNNGCGNCFSAPSSGCNTSACSVSPVNTVTSGGSLGQLGEDVVSVSSTDGSVVGPVVSPSLIFSCAPAILLQKLATGIKGMAGIARSKVGLPRQFSSAFAFRPTFALCLPSSAQSTGAMFFGDGPYTMQPNVVVSKSLAFTPLVINPVGGGGIFSKPRPSAQYFITIKSIKINNKDVPVNSSLLSIDKNGNGGTKLSTIVPYTTLETSIYKALVTTFINEATALNMTRAVAVTPFKVCFTEKSVASTRAGPGVPAIDVVMDGGSSWRIWGANSMVRAKEGVLCLGVLDGGSSPQSSVVIGGHQLEDNLVQFDLEKNMLGFSSSLLLQQTTCSNFNFKATRPTTMA